MSLTKVRCILAVCVIAGAVAFSPLPLRSARAQDRVQQRIEDGREAVLRGNVHPLARAESDEGRASPVMALSRIVIQFNRTAAQQAELENLLREQQDPGSANYHKWLTPEQFGERFGLSETDLARVTDWLESRGFTIVERARSRTYVAFSGSVGQVDSVFRTEIHRYHVDGEEHFANAGEPHVPAVLADVVQGFHGLDDFRPRPRIRLQSHFTSSVTGNHYLAPDDFATIFNLQSLYKMGIDGTGQAIAIVGQANINLSDLNAFRSASALPPTVPQIILIPGSADPGAKSANVDEANLDLDWAGGVARNASLIYVNSTSAFNSMFYAVNNNLAPVVSVSYGTCERNFSPTQLTSFTNLGQQANAQGQTMLVASGDKGAADCETSSATIATHGLTVDMPSALPTSTSVGGTTLSDGGGTFGTQFWSADNNGLNGSALSYIPEIAWNDAGVQAASGGGASVNFSKPSWQVGPGVPNDGKRDLPDVSFPASASNVGYLFCSLGSCVNGYRQASGGLTVAGGTSAGAPAMAGVVALLNQLTGTSQGNINPRLYQLAAVSGDAFHDVTSGNNNVSCQVGTTDCTAGIMGFSAGTGYDLVTGLGSINAFNLAMEWVPVAVSPSPISFGNRLPNIANTMPVTLKNNVSAVLNISGVSISGNFSQTNNCVGALAFGSACTINVSYLPSSLTPQAGTLTITADDSASPHLVPVTGNGSDLSLVLARPARSLRAEVNPAPVASVSPLPIANAAASRTATPDPSTARAALAALPAVVVAPLEIDLMSTRTIKVHNPRAVSVAITIEIHGSATQENDCGSELKAEASCEIKVGKGRGELQVTSPAGTATVRISD